MFLLQRGWTYLNSFFLITRNRFEMLGGNSPVDRNSHYAIFVEGGGGGSDGNDILSL